ncbi:telomerase reverse transcriptase [Daphnia magna]|uniref:telomerase reverse transcriptase n=1 Tax=Daphnia magna TaxID=35525 RepID=UPI001E1BB99F|nr:telomerase reverse transcriptase [Daphnia magna]XP_032779410.2 telomerase reverse transcriptase [Daphnia magna]XP_032779412.2 telomerase reverse transcriptase [Daphnia magna]XP_032779413.2 telomerase reverse transcriptase [Daphnia magna]XP_045025682.1 telomerase reverse transcriptase [Daphnia magna]XP_045025683.1 telomerase reverse transcriptase [Daphnia magna]
MTESGFSVLEKVFADRQVVSLADFLKDDGTSSKSRLPQIFRNAAVVHVQTPECKPQAAPQVEPEQQLDWYELTESCDSNLFMRGLKDKWYLPCVATTGQPMKTCECPFIPHAARSDWAKLHSEFGAKKMKCLLIHCSIFVLVGRRAWLQISGPLDKGDLERMFPPIFQYRAIPKAVKRKKEEHAIAKAPKTSNLPFRDCPSVQRPLKKIRLTSSDGQSHSVEFLQHTTKSVVSTIDNIPDMKPLSTSLVPILKKVRLKQGDSLSPPIHLTLVVEPQKDCAHASIRREEIGKKKTRRGRNKLITKQIVDKRTAINGSMKIPHDEILYSSSGWTHFPITHPVSHASPIPTVLAILRTSVGGECSESEDQLRSDLPLLGELIEAMMKNHRRCRYNPIVRRMLADSNGDSQKSFVDASRVYQFIRCIVKKVVPIELLGDQTNQQVFLSNVRRFIEAGRGTSFTLNDLIQSMRTSKCRWFSHLPSLAVKISLLARLIVWLFMGFVKPLIRQHFYATETSYGRNRIFFYSKDVWQKIHHRMLRSICSVSLRQPLPVLEKWTAPNSTSELQNLLLFARLRFVPKKNGARPIMSTKFRNTNRKQVNTARLLLHTITSLYVEGMDAKSTHSLHRKWVDYVECRDTENPVYFVHADIEDAFGSIDHDKMVDLLLWYAQNLPRELQVRTFCNVTPDGRRSKPFQIIPHFHRDDPEGWVQQMAPGSVVFHTGTRVEKLNTVKILEFAIRSVREVHVVHHDKAHYQLKRGIPQGSRLSSALCHIYYGHMVREHLSEFLSSPDDLLIRVVDDFLYLTASGERARAFHHRIHQGFTDYNAYVNIDKSATNLDLSIPSDQAQAPPVRKPVWFSFCGLQFHTKTLEIRGDYTKYEGTDIIHCITPSTGEPGKLLLKRIQGISTLKIETVYLDARVNRKPTIVRSMFNACLMAAFRFHAIVKQILMRTVPRHLRDKAANNARYLAHTVIKECCSKMVGHVSSVRRRRKDVKIILSNTETAWLCYEAFHRKLSRHGKLYSNVLLAVRVLQTEHEKKIPNEKLKNLRSWIGKRIPLSFRRMKDHVR